jgi:hypothetical protein
MTWCCQGFESAYLHAGERGFAILVGKDPAIGPYFVWQHRAIDKGREAEIQGPLDVSVVSDTGLLFCPWCGKNLRRFYGRHADELTRPGFEIQLRASQ